LLSPGHSVPTAGILAVGLYTFSNVVYALVAYPIGVLADRYSKRFILTMGYILFALVCFGFIILFGGVLALLAAIILFSIHLPGQHK